MIHRVLGARYGWRWWVWSKIVRREIVWWDGPFNDRLGPQGSHGYFRSSLAHYNSSSVCFRDKRDKGLLDSIRWWCSRHRMIGVMHETGEVVYPVNRSKAMVAV